MDGARSNLGTQRPAGANDRVARPSGEKSNILHRWLSFPTGDASAIFVAFKKKIKKEANPFLPLLQLDMATTSAT